MIKLQSGRSRANGGNARMADKSVSARRVGACGSMSRAFLLALICTCLVGLTVWVGQALVDTHILLTSLISSAVVTITAPESKASHPMRVLTSHLIAAVTGLVLRYCLPMSPWSVAAAVGIALLIVLIADRLHPPAMANAGIMFSANGTALELICLVAVVALILTGSAFLSRRYLMREGCDNALSG